MENKLGKLSEKIKNIYPHEYQKVIDSLSTKRRITFRINSLLKKKDVTIPALKESILKNLTFQGFDITQGPFENSFIVNSSKEKKLSETEEFKNNEIYIQELSSMIPVLLLEPKEGENVLDLCAAPGSKTTQLAELSNNKGFITAVERSKDRFFALKANLQNYGVQNITLILANGVGLEKRNPQFINFFDKVLIDAPCTNEARINTNEPDTYKFWNPKKYKDLSRVQKGLIISGIRMLKPGGTLIYSTCTFSVEENEFVIDWLLKKFPELVIEKLDTEKINVTDVTVKEGITLWKEKPLNEQIKNTYRILPNELFGGFYIANIKKPL